MDTAQNVVNIPVICSYTGELICPQMPQNEERNISTDSNNRIVHLQDVLPTNFTIFSSFSMIMAAIAQSQWVLAPRIFAALDFPRKIGLPGYKTPNDHAYKSTSHKLRILYLKSFLLLNKFLLFREFLKRL